MDFLVAIFPYLLPAVLLKEVKIWMFLWHLRSVNAPCQRVCPQILILTLISGSSVSPECGLWPSSDARLHPAWPGLRPHCGTSQANAQAGHLIQIGSLGSIWQRWYLEEIIFDFESPTEPTVTKMAPCKRFGSWIMPQWQIHTAEEEERPSLRWNVKNFTNMINTTLRWLSACAQWRWPTPTQWT